MTIGCDGVQHCKIKIDERRSWTDTERDWVNNSDSSSARRVADGPITAGRAATRAGCCIDNRRTYRQRGQRATDIQHKGGRNKGQQLHLCVMLVH